MAHTVPTEFTQEKNKQVNQPTNLYALYDYDSLKVSGSATSTSANHLIDSAAAFVAADVGKTVYNTVDSTYAIITVINSTIDVTLSKDIMENGEAYNKENNLYFAEAKADIVFDGITYTAFPIALDPISESTTGEIDSIRIKMGNASRVIQAYIENYDMRGKKVGIKIVWANLLADTDNYLEYVFYIDNYDFTAASAVFTCSSKFDVLNVELPYGKYTRGVCRWIFRGAICLYSGAQATCNLTMADCRIRQNILRFGAFPSIPMQRTYLG